MNGQVHLPESSFSKDFANSIEVHCCVWRAFRLSEVRFYMSNKLVLFLLPRTMIRIRHITLTRLNALVSHLKSLLSGGVLSLDD